MIATIGKNSKKSMRYGWHVLDDLTWNYPMKHLLHLATVAMFTVKMSCNHFHSSSFQGNIFLHQNHATYIVQTITQKMESNIKITEKDLSQSCILCQLLRTKTLASGSKYIKHFCFYHYLSYIWWVDVIYLTCLVFLKSPWFLVWIFCAPILLT